MKSFFHIARICLGIIFSIAGIILIIEWIWAIFHVQHLSAYAAGHLTGSLILSLIAFALAWQCLKNRA